MPLETRSQWPKRRPQTRPPKRDKHSRTHLVADDIVSPNGLAMHLGMSRQNVKRLTAEAVLVRRSEWLL